MTKISKTVTVLTGRFGSYDCLTCRRPRINVMSGSVCGFGCDGKILIAVPKEVHQIAKAMLRGDIIKASHVLVAQKAAGTAPPAAPAEPRFKTNQFWIFEGKLWRKVRLDKDEKRPKTDRIVLMDKKPIQITPWDEVNETLAKSEKVEGVG